MHFKNLQRTCSNSKYAQIIPTSVTFLIKNNILHTMQLQFFICEIFIIYIKYSTFHILHRKMSNVQRDCLWQFTKIEWQWQTYDIVVFYENVCMCMQHQNFKGILFQSCNDKKVSSQKYFLPNYHFWSWCVVVSKNFLYLLFEHC